MGSGELQKVSESWTTGEFWRTQADSKMHWAQMECDPREEGAISVAWGGPSSRERGADSGGGKRHHARGTRLKS